MAKYRSTYKGITFAKGYNKPFAEFKEEFQGLEVFKQIPYKQKAAEMKKVHARVLQETKQFAKDEKAAQIEVNAEEIKTDKNGDTKTASEKSAKAE